MLIYIQTQEKTNAITYTHYMPFDEEYGLRDENNNPMTEEQMLKTGFLVEKDSMLEVDKAPKIEGKSAYVTYTPEKGFEYAYADIPKNFYRGVAPETVMQIQDDMTLELIGMGVL